MLDTLTKGGNSAADASSIAPIHDVVDAYARAAGLSHFAVDGAEALAAARRLRAGLPLALAVDRVRVARETAGTGAEMAELSKRSAELRGHAIRGEHIDGVEIERLSVDADEVAFRARLSSLETRLRDVDSAAEAAGLSAADFENGLSTVRGVVRHIRVEMIGWVGALDAAHQYQGPIHSLGAAASVLEQRRDAVRHAQGGLTGLDATLGLQDFFTRAQHEVRDETLRTAVVHLARDLAIMVVSAQIASGAVGVVRGVMTAREAMIAGEVIEASAGATLAYSAVEVGVQAGVWTLASGDPSARGFAENALAIGLAEIAMRPFAKLFESLGSAEAEVQTVRQLARAAGRAGVKLGAEVGVGMGAATAAHAITHFGKVEAATWDGWITQGLALVAGRYVHASTKGMHSRVESAAKELGRNAATVFERKVVTLEHRSASTKRETTPDEALELLARNHELLLEERSLYQSIVGEGASSPNLEAVDAQIGAVSPELADVPLRLSGLRPVAGKDIFEGTGPQVAKALRAAADMGFQVESRVDSKTAARTVRLNGREITIYEPDAPRDSATTREWADALATSHPHPMSPAEARTDTAAFTERRQAVDRMYDEAMHGERATPAGVSQERLQLAVKGDAITGERIPLTYGADPAEAAKLFTSSRARSRPFSSRKASPTPPSSSSAPGRPAGAPRPARPARHGARRAMRTSQSSATRCSHKLAHSMSRSTRRTSRVAVTRP